MYPYVPRALAPTVSFSPGDRQKVIPFTVTNGYDSKHVFAISAQLNSQISTAYVAMANSNLHPGVSAFLGSIPPGTNTVAVAPGETISLLFTLESLQGYSGIFSNMECIGLPPGASCDFAASQVQLLPGGFAQVAFNLSSSSSTPMGQYPITVRATDGAISPGAAVTFGVGDFAISLDPATIVVNSSAPPSTTISVSYLNGFGEVINASCSGLPFGLSCTSPATLYPSNLTSTLTVGLPFSTNFVPGTYPFQVTASSKTVSHTVTATLIVANFTASLDKTTASIANGGSVIFNVLLTSKNHFASSGITLSCQGAASVTCESPAVSLVDGGTATSQLTVTYNRNAAAISRSRTSRWHPWALVSCLLMTMLPWRKSRVRNCRWNIVTLLLLTFVASCGGGGGGSGGSGGGSQTVSVTVYANASVASGVLQESAGTITLTPSH